MWPFSEEKGRKKKKIDFQVSSYFREVLVKNNHYVSSSETLKSEQLCLAFRSLQSQQAQVQLCSKKVSQSPWGCYCHVFLPQPLLLLRLHFSYGHFSSVTRAALQRSVWKSRTSTSDAFLEASGGKS